MSEAATTTGNGHVGWVKMKTNTTMLLYPYPFPTGYCINDRDSSTSKPERPGLTAVIYHLRPDLVLTLTPINPHKSNQASSQHTECYLKDTSFSTGASVCTAIPPTNTGTWAGLRFRVPVFVTDVCQVHGSELHDCIQANVLPTHVNWTQTQTCVYIYPKGQSHESQCQPGGRCQGDSKISCARF